MDYRGTNLNVKAPHWIAIVHGVESRNLVHAHRWHLQSARNLIHDANAGEAVLALTEVKQRHHGGFLVLRRVALEDLGDEFFIGGVEFEGDGGIINGGVSMLGGAIVKLKEDGWGDEGMGRTT